MAGLVRNKSIAADLRRMGPVLGIVLGTAVVSLVSIRSLGVQHLRAATASHPDACRIADMHQNNAASLMPEIRTESLEKAKTAPSPEALGRLRDDARVDKVIEELNRAIDLCPARELLHEMVASAYWYDGAATMTYYHLGRRALLLKHPDEAAIQFRLAMEADPKADLPLYYLALSIREAGDAAGARKVVEENLPRFESQVDGQLVAGRVLASDGDAAQAAQLLQKGLLARPTDEDAIRDLSTLALRSNRLRETADFLVSLDLQDRRTIPAALSNAASLYRREGNLVGEEDALRRALRLFPNSAVLNFELAVVLHKTDRKSEARDLTRRAMEHSRSVTLKLIQERGIDPGS